MGITSSKSRSLLRRAQTLLRRRLPKRKTQLQLPDDVVFDILSRVPVKSLCRLRCVSKELRAIISDPAFLAAHKSRTEPLIIVGGHDESLRLVDMDGGNLVKVINGVGRVWKLLCTSRDNLVCAITSSGDVKVVDLASGEVVMACRREERSGLLGFGCCAAPSSVYKMVHFTGNTFEIITLGDGGVGWRPMQPPPTSNKISYRSNPVAVNGVLHLMLDSQLDDGDNIICFDLAEESWKEKGIKGPPNVDLDECYLGNELNGSLCMVQSSVRSSSHSWTNIWLLADSNKSSWVKVYTIPLYSSMFFRLIPLRMLRDGRRLLFCCTLDGEQLSMVRIYDSSHSVCIDEPKTLVGVHDGNFSLCNLHLESFVLAKR